MFYYHSDHLGSFTFLTDESGTPRQFLLYLPFGEVLLDHKAGGYESRYKYTSKETDEHTGLNYPLLGAVFTTSVLCHGCAMIFWRLF